MPMAMPYTQPANLQYAPQAPWGVEPAQDLRMYGHQPTLPFQPQQQEDLAPFLHTTAPNGMLWARYVRTGIIYVDANSGLLGGPWAECICWAVCFEHRNDWQKMPQYSGDGPVGGILTAFETAVAGRMESPQLVQAAMNLEEAAHAAARSGRALPIIDQNAEASAPVLLPQTLPASSHPPCGTPSYGQPTYGHQPVYGEQPYHSGQLPNYGQQSTAGQHHGYGQGFNGGDQQLYPTGGPTLLQQGQPQGGGMSTGTKVALAAATGMAVGGGGYYLATHMDEVSHAVGDAGGFVGDVGGAALGFAGDAVEGMGHLVGGAANDVGDFVEDMF